MKSCLRCCARCRKPWRGAKVANDVCNCCRRSWKRFVRGRLPRGWQRIFYVIEGGVKPFRCEHRSTHFVVIRRDDVKPLVVCAHGFMHEPLAGFYLEDEAKELAR
jgi:hypothetical protein